MPKSKNKTTTASDGSSTAAGIDGKSAKNGNAQADDDTLNNQEGVGAAAATSGGVDTSISVDKKDSIGGTTSTTTTEKEDSGPVKQQSPDNAGKEVADTNNKNGKDKDDSKDKVDVKGSTSVKADDNSGSDSQTNKSVPNTNSDTSCAQKSKETGNNTNKDNDKCKGKDETLAANQQSSAANPSPAKQTNNVSSDTSKSNNSNPSRSNITNPSRTPVATVGNPAKSTPIQPQQTSMPPPTTTALSTNTINNASQSNNNNNNALSADFDNNNNDYYSADSKDTLLTMTFNQDGGCLAVGTGSGFRICNVHPFQETFRRSLGGGGGGGIGMMEGGAGIAHIEMLYRTNLLALTGHSTSPHYPPNKVLIYDDHLQRTIGELSFRQKVLTAKLRRDRIVVVLRDRVYIYNFSDLALLDKVHTGDNPLGLIGISMDNGGVGGSTTSAGGVERAGIALGSAGAQRENNGLVLACPSTQRGQVRVELYGLRRTTFMNAHESALGALALSVDGSLLATASERGTVIRLFDTRGVTIGGGSNSTTGKKIDTALVSSSVPLREFRRGVERATISCLTFSLDSNWLGCASNHGTVHIFQTQDPTNNSSVEKKSKSSSMTGKAMRMLPKLVAAPKKYLMDGEHSYAQVRGVPHPRACAFVPDREQTLAVAGMDEYGNGCLLLAEFGKPTSNDGKVTESKVDDTEARRLGYHRFFKCKSPASQTGRRRTKSKDSKYADDGLEEGGAYIDDAPVDLRMNHISIGDENEDHFVPIDYNGET